MSCKCDCRLPQEVWPLPEMLKGSFGCTLQGYSKGTAALPHLPYRSMLDIVCANRALLQQQSVFILELLQVAADLVSLEDHMLHIASGHIGLSQP